MLTNVTSLTGNGLKDWIIQRVTALTILAYASFLLIFFGMHPHLSYETWLKLWQCHLFKGATLATLAALGLHSWIGLWTVTTDYIKCAMLRLMVQLGILAFVTGQFIWGFFIVCGC